MNISDHDLKSIAITVFLCIVILLLFTGCRTKKMVCVPVDTGEVKTDSVYLSSTRVDSIYVNRIYRDSVYTHDSVYIHERGDTVLVEKTKYKYIQKLRYDTVFADRLRIDTCYLSKMDSIKIPQPYPVEKELTKWQQLKVNYGGWAIAILSGLCLSGAVLIGLKLKS